jgi:hypothetical protein
VRFERCGQARQARLGLDIWRVEAGRGLARQGRRGLERGDAGLGVVSPGMVWQPGLGSAGSGKAGTAVAWRDAWTNSRRGRRGTSGPGQDR